MGNLSRDWLTLRITFAIVHLHVQCDIRVGSCRSRDAHTCEAGRAVMNLSWERVQTESTISLWPGQRPEAATNIN